MGLAIVVAVACIGAQQPAQQSAVEQPAVEQPALEAPGTSMDTGVALQEALASHLALAYSGDAATSEAELAAARVRATSTGGEVAISAAGVHAAYEAHIDALIREHDGQVGDLRDEQAAYAP